jgi:hypothetical protein
MVYFNLGSSSVNHDAMPATTAQFDRPAGFDVNRRRQSDAADDGAQFATARDSLHARQSPDIGS